MGGIRKDEGKDQWEVKEKKEGEKEGTSSNSLYCNVILGVPEY